MPPPSCSVSVGLAHPPFLAKRFGDRRSFADFCERELRRLWEILDLLDCKAKSKFRGA